MPGSSFGFYIWGDPDDEPLQPLASSPWAVRNAVPLAPAGNIRMLDAIEARLASGRPSAGLAGYLRRAGIGHLVVRNDLRSGDEPAPVLVHQALDGSPGIRRVAEFGPRVGRAARFSVKGRNVVVDDGWTSRYHAVEIYEVAGASRAVVASGSPLVVGGPEDLLDLTDAGLIGDAPAVLAVDAPKDVEHDGLILTDGLRRRETDFARIEDAKSATLEAGDDGRRGAPARDYTLGDGRWETHARILGARTLSASSSRAFADTPGAVLPETLPFAAFDGLLSTAWESGPSGARRPWVGIDLASPRTVPSVVVVLADEPGHESEATRIRVETEQGSSNPVVALPNRAVTIRLPAGPTSSLKVVSDGPLGRGLSVAEVQVPGVDVDRTLELPWVPARWGAPDSILLSSTAGWRDACVKVGRDVRCGAGLGRVGEEPGALDRTVRLGKGAAYVVSAKAAPVDGDALQGLIQRDQLVNVRASTTAVDDARASAVAAIDGDQGTTWVADADDADPTLSVRWQGTRTVRSVGVSLDPNAAASRATRVELVYPGGRQTVDLDDSGTAPVTPFRASHVDVRLVKAKRTTNLRADGTGKRVGVGVSELRLAGTGLLPITLSDIAVDTGCAFGPTLRVGIGLYQTRVTASPRELFDGGMLPVTVCGPARIDVPAGSTRVVLAPAPAFRGVQVVMRAGQVTAPEVTPAALSSASPAERELTVPAVVGRTDRRRAREPEPWLGRIGAEGRHREPGGRGRVAAGLAAPRTGEAGGPEVRARQALPGLASRRWHPAGAARRGRRTAQAPTWF